MDNQQNPWFVKDIEEFLYFCCPECDVKDQSKELFLKHALDQHPNAKEGIQPFMDNNIKEEPFNNEQNYDLNNDECLPDTFLNSDYSIGEYRDILKCEIKDENKDYKENENMTSKELFEGPKNRTCITCGKTFKGPAHLRRHIESIHERKKHYCEFCENKTFTQDANLQLHIKTHHSEEILNYVEPSDFDISINQEDWKMNEEVLKNLVEKSDLNNYSNDSPNRTLIWERITNQFNILTGNNWNWNDVSLRWKNYIYKAAQKRLQDSNWIKCDFCTKIFTKKEKLENHIKNRHKKFKRQCHICSKFFTNKSDFEGHYIETHGIFKMYRCEFCSKEFEKRDLLSKHVNIYHKGKNSTVVCDLCGKSYSSESSLKKHHRAVHEGIKDHLCEFCNKAFSESNDLNIHIKCVHKGVRDQICDLCGQGFVNSWSLKNHIKNIHEGIKDHICKICGKAFTNKYLLSDHTKTIHEGRKPHKCLLCDRRFTKPSKVKLHMKSAHRGVNLESI